MAFGNQKINTNTKFLMKNYGIHNIIIWNLKQVGMYYCHVILMGQGYLQETQEWLR